MPRSRIRGVTPPLPNTPSRCGAQLRNNNVGSVFAIPQGVLLIVISPLLHITGYDGTDLCSWFNFNTTLAVINNFPWNATPVVVFS
jgi:hypothetical protein